MSATAELRRLLDERGIAADASDNDNAVYWFCGMAEYEQYPDGSTRLIVYDAIPEQAIDVTVGRETCHTVLMDCFGNPPYNQSGLHGNDVVCGCSECGAPWGTTGLFRGCKLKHNFKACPICGRVVE